jgi:hypothetical protein
MRRSLWKPPANWYGLAACVGVLVFASQATAAAQPSTIAAPLPSASSTPEGNREVERQQGHSQASARCSIATITIRGEAGTVAARGVCQAHHKPVPGRWSWSYRGFDPRGNSCDDPATTGSGSTFYLYPDAPYRFVVTFTLSAIGVRSQPATKTSALFWGNQLTECQPLGSAVVTSAAVLCPWSDPYWTGIYGDECGTMRFDSTGAPLCGWTTPPTLTGNLVSAGHFACASGDCSATGGFPTTRNFYGYPVEVRPGFMCWAKPRVKVSAAGEVDLGTIRLVNPAGQVCEFTSAMHGELTAFRSFRFPPSWGGTLYVSFLLATADSTAVGRGYEVETAVFNLAGSGGACVDVANP